MESVNWSFVQRMWLLQHETLESDISIDTSCVLFYLVKPLHPRCFAVARCLKLNLSFGTLTAVKMRPNPMQNGLHHIPKSLQALKHLRLGFNPWYKPTYLRSWMSDMLIERKLLQKRPTSSAFRVSTDDPQWMARVNARKLEKRRCCGSSYFVGRSGCIGLDAWPGSPNVDDLSQWIPPRFKVHVP